MKNDLSAEGGWGPGAQEVKREEREKICSKPSRTWGAGRKSEHTLAWLTFLLIVNNPLL